MQKGIALVSDFSVSAFQLFSFSAFQFSGTNSFDDMREGDFEKDKPRGNEGAPPTFEDFTMNQWIFVAALAALALAGCGQEPKAAAPITSAAPTVAAAPTPAPTPVMATDAAKPVGGVIAPAAAATPVAAPAPDAAKK